MAIIVATMLVALLPATALGASGAPMLATGVARDTNGRLAGATGLLFHDNLRDHGRLELIGRTRTAADGSYALRFGGNQATRQTAAVNDGFVNFFVSVRSASHSVSASSPSGSPPARGRTGMVTRR